MNITVYCYDDIHNPRCGGGGAYRELSVHRVISSRHSIRFYTGNFQGARNSDEPNFRYRHLGFKASYLLSRVSFSLFATIHSLFSRADIVAIPYSIYSPVLTFLFKPRKTVVLFFHRTGTEAVTKYGTAGLVPLLMEKLVLGTARNFITLTDSMAAEILAGRPNVKARAGYVSFDTSLLTEKPADGKFVLCFGRIDIHMKGIDILVPAFEKVADRFPEHRLVVAGRGKETDTAWLQKRINESPFRGRIECVVNASDEEKKRLFRTATIVCMPSRYEGWNIAAVEAAAMGKATLGTRIHGLQDAIRDNETGLLVPPGDAGELAKKMEVLLSNVGLREKLGANGRVWARRFTLDRVAGIQEEFYNELYLAHRT